MESSSFIRAKLEIETNAACSYEYVEHNRYQYGLRFERPIEWQDLYDTVRDLDSDFEANLRMGEIRPCGVLDFEVTVRELDRRPEIDDDQSGLTDFEQKA